MLITKDNIAGFLDHSVTTGFFSVVTIWALFGDDIRLLVGDSQSDTTFYILTLVCFSFFSLEIVLSCYAKNDYINSFYFYLDAISTFTLLLDVGWISDAIFGSASSGATAAKVGTRATRLIRILRLIRLIRIVKLYKAAQVHREKIMIKRRKEMLRQKAAYEKIRLERAVRLMHINHDPDQSVGNGTFRKSPRDSIGYQERNTPPGVGADKSSRSLSQRMSI